MRKNGYRMEFVVALLLACPAAAQTSWRFDFGEGAPAAGFRKVTITDTFSTITG
jgi:hypothetical protein